MQNDIRSIQYQINKVYVVIFIVINTGSHIVNVPALYFAVL